MKPRFTLLLAASLAGIALNLQASERGAVETSSVNQIILPQGLPAVQTDHPFERASALMAQIAAHGGGAGLDSAQFAALLGPDAAKLLAVLEVGRITIRDNRVTVTLGRPLAIVSKKGTRTQVDTTVTFVLRDNGSGRLSCTDITGVRIKSFWFIGWMRLQDLDLTLTTTGNTTGHTTIQATLDTHIGTVKRDSVLDAEGKPLP